MQVLFRQRKLGSCSGRALIRAATMQALEPRVLLSGYPLVTQTLPFALDFSSDRGRLVDKDGQGTGFTWVQTNASGNEYQPKLIDLDTAHGLLKIKSYGNTRVGSNYGSDDSLVNGLQVQFNSTLSGGFTIATRLIGPLSNLVHPNAQGGLMFGPDSNNYVKLIASANVGGQVLEFLDEQGGSTHALGGAGVNINIGAFSAINTLDLFLSGDASSGVIRAFYKVNGGRLAQFSTQLTLSGAEKSAFFGTKARGGLIVMHHNKYAPPIVTFDSFSVTQGVQEVAQPKVTNTRPANGMTNVARDFFVAADVKLPTPGAGIDEATLNFTTVSLKRTSDGKLISAVLNTAGGGDAIVLKPSATLDANTNYTFTVTAGLKDITGASFQPFTSTFTTGTRGGATDATIAFEAISLPTAQNQQFACVTIGPDHKLYATTLTGHIFRWSINSDGTLGAPQDITTVRDNNGGPRFVTGITFDPSSTANNLIAYVTHGQYAFENATDWTGKVSQLSGANLQNYQDYIVGLPRSIRDHLTNQLTFGPGGKLYFMQGSETAMGAPDNAWGLRHEHMLNAAVLAADVNSIANRIRNGLGPLDVRTENGGTYDPFAAGAPLTIYASGIRSAYDLLWHSNGSLYVPTNGSAAGGNTPAAASPFYSGMRIDSATKGPYTGPAVPGLNNVSTQDDFLFRVVQGGYYGHPDPARGEYVLNGGNPTSGADPNQVSEYPVGTMPDRNYRGSVFDFGKNYSPDGIIEYFGNAFGGQLNHSMLIARYSGGDDIVALTPAADGSIPNPDTNLKTAITGLTHFVDPLDLTEDKSNGNLYVVEYGANRITLARPLATSGAKIKTNTSRRLFNDPRGGAASLSRRVTITNIGTTALAIPSDGLQIVGADASEFDIINSPMLPMTISPGKSINLSIVFNPPSTTTPGIKTATLRIKSNDASTPIKNVQLRGLATTGEGGANEPSLQRILDLYQIPVNVGDTNSADTTFPVPPRTPNDEMQMPRLIKAGTGPVTIEPIAVFGVSANPTAQFGYYEPGEPDIRTLLFNVSSADAQTVNPFFNGATSFDPGGTQFGLLSVWPSLHNSDGGSRVVFSEDALNTWEANSANRRKVRFYPLKNSDGSVVANAYVFTFEEFNGSYDQNDLVGIIRNVRPVKLAAELSLRNLDNAAYPDLLTLNRIQHPNPTLGNSVHDTGKLRLANTGTQALAITNITLSNTTAWQLPNKPTFPLVINPGSSFDLSVKFVATSGGFQAANLTISTNDGDEQTKVVRLEGYWQSDSEANSQGISQEPTLATIGQAFNYRTVFVGPGQSLNTGGKVQAVGDEVLSPYWSRADSSIPVNIKQLAAFHMQGLAAKISWFNQGSSTLNTVFTTLGSDAQSFFPRTSTSGTQAQANINPSGGVFGFKIDTESSDDTKNIQEQSGGGFGHHLRFFPVRDRNGSYVPNQWIVVVDYRTTNFQNFDFQDNVYLISNIRPSNRLPAPDAGAAFASGAAITVDWSDVPGAAGYSIYRSNTMTGAFSRINSLTLTDSVFSDTGVVPGNDYFYRVVAVTAKGVESQPITLVGIV